MATIVAPGRIDWNTSTPSLVLHVHNVKHRLFYSGGEGIEPSTPVSIAEAVEWFIHRESQRLTLPSSRSGLYHFALLNGLVYLIKIHGFSFR